MAEQPQQGKLRLIIYTLRKKSFYLDIPIAIPGLLCTRPRKYLRYLGWCILGIEGRIAMVLPSPEDDIGDEGSLEDQGVYRYRYTLSSGLSVFIVACISFLTLRKGHPLRHAIDLEVHKTRSTVLSGQSTRSGTSSTQQEFLERLEARDGYCVVTGIHVYEAIHIIPRVRQDEVSLHTIESHKHILNPLSGSS
jgi:hypothetical protein